MSARFERVMAAVIVLNAIVLGAQTYTEGHAQLFSAVNGLFLLAYIAEAAARLWTAGSVRGYLGDKWNVFDLVVIGVALIPVTGQATQLLRLVRLVRVVKLGRHMPELKIALSAVTKALPGMASLLGATVLLLFVYGVAGTSLFEGDPHFANVGSAMLHLFSLLGGENLPDVLDEAQAASPWGATYFVSFTILAVYLLANLVIGLIVGVMESARDEADADVDGLDGRLAAAEDALSEARAVLGSAKSEVTK